jgi:replicative DNA helicase
VTELIAPVEMAAGWTTVETVVHYEHLRPLSDARQRFVREAQSGRRLFFGIPAIDTETRGISPGHLGVIVGYSNNGKTQLLLNILHHNRDKHIVLFGPDEPSPMILTKLTSLVFDVSARQLEAQVADGDRQALRMLDETVEEFPNLLIFDKPMTPKLVRRFYEEALDHWGCEGDLACFDYVDLLQCGEHLPSKMDAIKSFGTDMDVPVIALHQTSRSAGSQGRAMRIDSGFMGGETWATYQFGVWRKKFAIAYELGELYGKRSTTDEDADRVMQLHHEALLHDRTITVNLNKNKRPGGERIEDGLDFEVHPSGQLLPFTGLHLRSVT